MAQRFAVVLPRAQARQARRMRAIESRQLAQLGEAGAAAGDALGAIEELLEADQIGALALGVSQ